MARPLRIEFRDAVYHVTSRGDRCEPIYCDDRDRRKHLQIVSDGLHRFDARAFAYCLMGNHFHLVLQTRRANLSRLMRHINGVYTQSFNRRHGVTGHLLQGRFNAILVDRDSYLLSLIRYVERNPVAAGLAAYAAGWRWSSYRSHAGLESSPGWLETDEVLAAILGRPLDCAGDRDEAVRRYVEFVDPTPASDCAAPSIWSTALRGQIFLGDETFVTRMQRRATTLATGSADIPRAQRKPPLDLARYLRESVDRDVAIRNACLESGVTLSAVARALGLSVSRVSRIVAAAGQAKGKT